MRRVRPEQAVAEQKPGTDDGVADQHNAKPEGAQDPDRRGFHQHRAGGAGESQQPRMQGAQPKADLQHQRQQKRQCAKPHPEQKPADRGRGVSRDVEQLEIDDRVWHAAGMADIDGQTGHPNRQQRHDHDRRQGAAADIFKAESKRGQPHAGQRKPAAVERPAPGLLEVGDQQVDKNNAEHTDRNIDEKNPSPRGVGHDKATSGGPMTGPIRAGTLTNDIACTSSDLGMVRSNTSRPTGTIKAPPIPWTMRAPTRAGSDVAMPQPIEPSVNTMMARLNTRRAPKRSAVQPLTGMKTARLNR